MRNENEIINLLLTDVLKFHEELINKYIAESGIHDINMLESAVNTPFQSFGGNDLYPSVFDKAARLCYGLARNHPFTDGNKRTAVHTMLIYLGLNDIFLTYTQEEMENIIIAVASGIMSSEELSMWLKSHVKD